MNSEIPEKLFFKIGEVAEIASVEKYVLRYWEDEFDVLKPEKNRSGQRLYKRKDVELVLKIKNLLYEERYTIAGAQKKLRGKRKHDGQMSLDFNPEELAKLKKRLQKNLESILKILDK